MGTLLRFRFLIFILLSFSITAHSQEDQPSASLKSNTNDFGTVFRGATVEIVVEILNEGSGALNIAGVQTSMPALNIQVQRVVEPKSSTNMVLKLDTAVYSDQVDGKIVIVTNDPKSPNLTVNIKGLVQSNVDLQPNPPVFVQGFRWEAEKKEDVVSIQSRDGKPLKITDVQTEGEEFLANLSALEPEKRYQLSVKLNPKGTPRRAVGFITLITDSERIKFPVFTFLKDKVYLSPSDVAFAPVKLEEAQKSPAMLDFRKQSVFVYQYQGSDFQIQVQLPEYLSMERLPATGSGSVVDIPNQGKTAVFELIFLPNKDKLKKGSFQDTITITTNDPEFPILKLPVKLEVL